MNVSANVPANVKAFVENIDNPSIVLLKSPGVLEWLYGEDTFKAFLNATERGRQSAEEYRKSLQALENDWGRKLPIRGMKGLQWTNNFGEILVEELFTIQGKTVSEPKSRNGKKPDREINTHMLEAKAETHFTSGTAGEKILGTPFKYAEVPRLFEKPLLIVCLGGAEVSCRHQYGNIGDIDVSEEKKAFLAFFRTMGIEYVGATDILSAMC